MFDVCMEPTKDDNVCENAQAYAQACAAAGHPVVGVSVNHFIILRINILLCASEISNFLNIFEIWPTNSVPPFLIVNSFD